MFRAARLGVAGNVDNLNGAGNNTIIINNCVPKYLSFQPTSFQRIAPMAAGAPHK